MSRANVFGEQIVSIDVVGFGRAATGVKTMPNNQDKGGQKPGGGQKQGSGQSRGGQGGQGGQKGGQGNQSR
jgi:hypothetical protein